MDTVAVIDQDYLRSRERAEWRIKALAAARADVALCDELALVESEIERRQGVQRELLTGARGVNPQTGKFSERTFFPDEARVWDNEQRAIDAAQAKLETLLRRALPAPGRY